MGMECGWDGDGDGIGWDEMGWDWSGYGRLKGISLFRLCLIRIPRSEFVSKIVFDGAEIEIFFWWRELRLVRHQHRYGLVKRYVSSLFVFDWFISITGFFPKILLLNDWRMVTRDEMESIGLVFFLLMDIERLGFFVPKRMGQSVFDGEETKAACWEVSLKIDGLGWG